MSHTVILYSLEGCPHCKRVKEFFAKEGISYTNHDVGENPADADEMIKISGQRGVPVTIIDGEHIIVGDDIERIEKFLK